MAIVILKACGGDMKLVLSEDLEKAVFAEAIRCHPHEACGFVLGEIKNGERTATAFVACKNIQNELHAADPLRYPRTAETAYVIDPKEQALVEKMVKEKGLAMLAVFHSHPEHGVYFSAEDKTNAAPWGEPLFPELSYLVVSVYDKKIKGMSDFCWDAEKSDFVEVKMYSE